MINPFSNDIDRSEIWEMLVARDIAAFVAADWSMVANDFIETGFMGIDAKRDPNPEISHQSPKVVQALGCIG